MAFFRGFFGVLRCLFVAASFVFCVMIMPGNALADPCYTVTLHQNYTPNSGGTSTVYANANGVYADSACQNPIMAVSVPSHPWGNGYKFLGYYTTRISMDTTDSLVSNNRWIDEYGDLTSAGVTGFRNVNNNNTILYARWNSWCQLQQNFDGSTYCGTTRYYVTPLWGRQVWVNGGTTGASTYHTNLADCVENANAISAYTPAIPTNIKSHSVYIGHMTTLPQTNSNVGILDQDGSFLEAALTGSMGISVVGYTWYAACTCEQGWQGFGCVNSQMFNGTNWYTAKLCSEPCAEGTTITLDDNGGSGGSEYIYTSKNGNQNAGVYTDFERSVAMTTTNNPVNVPSNSQYTFAGYYNTPNGGTQYIDASGHITTAGLNAGKSYGANDTDVVWYAYYPPTTFNVVYNKGAHATSGSTNYTHADGATYNQNYYVLNFNQTPISNYMSAAPGYTFIGWSKDANPTVQRTQSNNAINTGTASNAFTNQTPWLLQNDLNVYAAYLAKQYTVTYGCGNGNLISGAQTTKIATYGESYNHLTGVDMCSYSMHTFVRWGCKKRTTNVNIGTNWDIDGDVTCTAQWEECIPCDPGEGCNCRASVANNECVYDTSSQTGYQLISGNGTYHPICQGNKINLNWFLNNENTQYEDGPQYCVYGTLDGISPVPQPIKNGYEFKGWKVTAWQQ